jgi:hypothetical protein
MKPFRTTALNLPSLRLEGSLFLPDILEKAALGQGRLQTEADYALPKGLKLRDEASRAFQIASAQWRTFAALLDRADFNPQRASTQFISELLRDAFAYPVVAAVSAVQGVCSWATERIPSPTWRTLRPPRSPQAPSPWPSSSRRTTRL